MAIWSSGWGAIEMLELLPICPNMIGVYWRPRVYSNSLATNQRSRSRVEVENARGVNSARESRRHKAASGVISLSLSPNLHRASARGANPLDRRGEGRSILLLLLEGEIYGWEGRANLKDCVRL